MRAPLPVTVVTGFLGAGKTTLVNRWLLGVARGEIAVIVNEHGDVGIDGELLAARARTIVEITGGCVCCTTQAELVRALDDIARAESPPLRVLVETSGAASPAGVVRAISAGGREAAFALDGVITVVDAARIDAVVGHDLAVEQIGYADVVVLSRTDACERSAVEHAAAVLAGHNGATVVLEGARGVVASAATLDEALALRDADFVPTPELPTRRVKHVYESVSLTIDGEVDGDRFTEFIEESLAPFAGRLFRTKGILAVAGTDERVILQGVMDAMEITLGEPWGDAPRRSRLVVVGYALDGGLLKAAFAACAA